MRRFLVFLFFLCCTASNGDNQSQASMNYELAFKHGAGTWECSGDPNGGCSN